MKQQPKILKLDKETMPINKHDKKFYKKLKNRLLRRWAKIVENPHPQENKYCGWYW